MAKSVCANDANVHHFSSVFKIMREALSPDDKLTKQANECIQECVSESISFITSEAAERAQQEHRKIIHANDVLWAMESPGFENYAEALKAYLDGYREDLVMCGESRRTNESRQQDGADAINRGILAEAMEM